MDVQPGLKLNRRLEYIWGKFCHARNDKEIKISIISAFHSTIQKVIHLMRFEQFFYVMNQISFSNDI